VPITLKLDDVTVLSLYVLQLWCRNKSPNLCCGWRRQLQLV